MPSDWRVPVRLEQQFRPHHNCSLRSLGNSLGLGIVAKRVRVYRFAETRA